MRKFVVKVDGVAYDVEVEEVGGVATAEVVAPKVEVKAPVKKAEAKPVAKTVPVGNGVKLGVNRSRILIEGIEHRRSVRICTNVSNLKCH